MSGKKAKPDVPSKIPNLLLISGDIINPVKFLMDTAGQVFGERSQDQSENTNVQNHVTRSDTKTSHSSKERESRHKQMDQAVKICKADNREHGRRRKSECPPFNQKVEIYPKADGKSIKTCGNIEEYTYEKNKTRKGSNDDSLLKECNTKHIKNEQMQIPQPYKHRRRKSETPPYRPKEDQTYRKTSDNLDRRRAEKYSDEKSSFLHPDSIKEYSRRSRRKSETPAYNLQTKDHYSQHHQSEVHKDEPSSPYRLGKRRQSVPSLVFDQPEISNYGSKALNRMAIGNLNASSTDLSENALRSGHRDLGSSFFSNTAMRDENQLQLNMLNCPNNSTVQCFCGHINCPCCNLMMNLEITDPTIYSENQF